MVARADIVGIGGNGPVVGGKRILEPADVAQATARL